MKSILKYTFIVLLFSVALSSCKNTSEPEEKTSKTEQTVTESELSGTKTIDPIQSTIIWKGHKVMGSHTGSIQLKSGQLAFENGALTSGNFVVDMSSIRATELMQEDDDEEEHEHNDDGGPEHDDRDDLSDHLKNEDFFAVSSYPEASLVIKSSQNRDKLYHITGDITIKGITKEVTFDARLNDNVFESNISINRTDFGIKYGSGSFFDNLGDRVIKDHFDLIITLYME